LVFGSFFSTLFPYPSASEWLPVLLSDVVREEITGFRTLPCAAPPNSRAFLLRLFRLELSSSGKVELRLFAIFEDVFWQPPGSGLVLKSLNP